MFTVATVVMLVLLTGASQTADASHGGIPSSVRAILRAGALRIAAIDGDRHPYDIEAVRTTIAKANRATDCHCKTFVPQPNTSIYLVAMRGHFSCNSCSSPPGAKIGPGTVITLESPVEKPAQFGGFGLGRRYPKLEIAGTPVRL
jgi:hypothetical protein